MAFLVWGGGSPLAAQTLVPDSLLQTRARLSCTGGALWGSQPTWGVNWHGFSMALWGHRGKMEWALGAQTEGSPVWRETQAWLGLGTTWDDRLRGAMRMNVGWVSWPEVQRHVPLVDVLGQVHQRETWGEGGRRQWGVFVLDGQGDWRGPYVMVRALDGRVWSQTPSTGWRMGVWVTQQGAREGSWTAQCSWSPSQQETFRCAWRWRWEP